MMIFIFVLNAAMSLNQKLAGIVEVKEEEDGKICSLKTHYGILQMILLNVPNVMELVVFIDVLAVIEFMT